MAKIVDETLWHGWHPWHPVIINGCPRWPLYADRRRIADKGGLRWEYRVQQVTSEDEWYDRHW